MKFGRILTMFAAVVFALLCGVGGAFSANYVEGEVLVISKSDVSTFASSKITRVSGKNIVHLRSETKSTEELIRELKDDPRVESVQPNYIYKASAEPNDPRYNSLWGMRKIKADEAWDSHRGNGSVVVAVLDSGIDYTHEDLRGNMVRDSGGFFGRNLVSRDSYPMDDNGHGTHVAGTIGAVGNNKIGVVGVAWNVGLLAVKVLDDKGDGTTVQVADGIAYLLRENAISPLAGKIKVANLSLGGWGPPGSDPALELAISSLCDAGIVVAMSAGNEYQNISNPNEYPAGWRPYPSSFKFSSTISVGATDNADRKASYSNYSSEWVDIAAPGGDFGSIDGMIVSTYPVSLLNLGYNPFVGTSMAAPHVAGAAALLFMAFPTETAVQIKNRILNNANIDVGVREGYWAKGRLNLKAALDNYVTVENVALIPTRRAVGVGDSFNLRVEISPSNAANKAVIWDSSNSAIATVSAGKVTGVKSGDATITATTVDGDKTATCVVSVGQKYRDPELPIGTPENIESAEAVGMNINTAIAQMSGKFKASDFTTNQNDKAVVTYQVAKTAAEGAIDSKREDVRHALSLPVFTASIAKIGNVAAVPFSLSGASFFANKAENIKPLKILSSGVGEMFTFTSVPEDVADGMFAVQKAGETDFYSGAIDVNAQYMLLLFIKDNGRFDLDGKADGSVMDPAALLKIETVSPSGGGGGGGCSAAYLPFTLLLAVPLVFRKKK